MTTRIQKRNFDKLNFQHLQQAISIDSRNRRRTAQILLPSEDTRKLPTAQ
jgi:hypothetical protein